MKDKRTFWISAAFAVSFACAPALAQTAQQDGKLKPLPSLPSMDMAAKNAQRTIPGAYRLTYTLTEMEGNKRVGSQLFQVVLDADAPPARLDLQTTVRIRYGSANSSDIRSENIGVRIFARLRQFANGMELNTEIHQNAIARGVAGQGAIDGEPVIRGADLSSTVLLTENKPVTIGELDIPGSTHRMQVQVELTPLR